MDVTTSYCECLLKNIIKICHNNVIIMCVKVSVVVPVHNSEKYLAKCLKSLINQTLDDIEIICVNDGSIDSSLRILNEYSMKDSRIKIINQDNLGPGAARNRGLLECKGEYISFIDSDDWIETEAYEKLYEFSKKKFLDLIFFSICTYDERTNNISSDNDSYNLNIFDNKFDEKIFYYRNVKDILFHISTGPVNKLYNKEFLDKNGLKFVEGLYFEDNVFFYDVFLKAKKCALLRDVHYVRRYREGSITQSHDDKYFDLIKILQIIVEIFKETNNYNEFKIGLITFIINHLDWTYSLINERYKKIFFEMIKEEFKALNLKNKDLELLPLIIKDKYYKFIDNDFDKSFSSDSVPISDRSLVIGYAFPPFSDTSAITLSKRVLNMDGIIDVVQNDIGDIRKIDESLNKIFGHNINKKFLLNAPTTFFEWEYIKIFVSSALKKIDKFSSDYYKEVYSITMLPASHFLAFEYKMNNPKTHWIAEFSDPMLYDIEGNERISKIHDEKYLNRINKYLNELNLPLAKNSVSFLCEYLPFIFADEIIFTNSNQMDYMLNKFPYREIKDLVLKKSKVKPYPVLPKKMYHLVESDYFVDKSCINFAYFGVFYGSRNLESLFYAFENIDENLKKKFKFHVFTDNPNLIKDLTDRLSVSDNLIINPYVNYLEFLNLCTIFDCLIVNDAEVKENLLTNPYLPSKLMDYLGSGTDIWAICERDSPLDGYDLKYKSYLDDYNSLKETMIQIMVDRSTSDKVTNEIENFKENINIIDNQDSLIKELNQEISFLKKRNHDLNIQMFKYNTRILGLRKVNYVANNDAVKRIETTKKLISEAANLKSYRFAYFLNRTRNSFIKGTKEEKKIYLKWIYLKLFRKNNPYNKRNNPLLNIVDRL